MDTRLASLQKFGMPLLIICGICGATAGAYNLIQQHLENLGKRGEAKMHERLGRREKKE